MSERGTFVTDYAYCDKCFGAVSGILLYDDHLMSQIIETPHGTYPISACRVSSHHPRGEIMELEREILPKISEAIRHDIRIAVVAETGDNIFRVKPKKQNT